MDPKDKPNPIEATIESTIEPIGANPLEGNRKLIACALGMILSTAGALFLFKAGAISGEAAAKMVQEGAFGFSGLFGGLNVVERVTDFFKRR